jgi:hemoglobin
MRSYYIILILIILLICYFIYRFLTFEKHTVSLYDRLGGVFPIAEIINHFSDALIINPIVGKNSKNKFLRDWNNNHLNRLPGLKFMRTLWVCAISGGPFKYSPTRIGKCPFSLENAHKKLQISPDEFDAVAEELTNSLNYFKVPEKEKNELLTAFASHKSDVIDGFLNANKIKHDKIKCN